MAEFIDIIAQLKFDVQGDGTLKDVNVSLDKATAEAKQLDAQIDGIKRSIKETDNQAAKGVLQKELKKVNAEAKQLKANTQGVQTNVKSLGGTFSSIGSLAAGAFTSFSILQLGQEVINATSQFQKFEAVLTNLTGSNDEAKQLIATFSEFAAETPFQVEEVVGAYVKLRNTGITPNIDAMRKLGDVASASGKDLNQLVEALIDAQVGENERLKEFGIRAQKVGEITKFTFRGVTTEVKNTSEAINAYITSLGDIQGVKGANEAIAKTLGGQISNLKDQFTGLFVEIGKASEGVLTKFISGISNALGFINNELRTNRAVQELITESGIKIGATTAEALTGQSRFAPALEVFIERIKGAKDATKELIDIISTPEFQAFPDALKAAFIGKVQKDFFAQFTPDKKDPITKALTDPKAAEKRKEAIADITADLQKAIADQQQKLQETEIKGKEESLETIRQLSELEKQEALRAIDDRQKAIAEKLGGKIPADIKNLLAELRTGIQRQFELALEQDIAEFKKKQEQAIIEFETKRMADKAKRKAEAAEQLAASRLALLAEAEKVNDELIAAVDIAENNAIIASEEAYRAGLISKEQHEKLKTEATDKGAKERIALLIEELNIQRLILEKFIDEGADVDGAFKEKLVAINVAISALKRQASEVGEVETKQNELFTTIKAGYNEALSIIQQVNAAIVANETAKINTLIALQQKRVDEANRIADEGNAEALEREQNRLETLMQQREEAAQRQQRLSLILQASNFALAASEAILAVTKAGAFGGPAAPVTIGLVGAALAAGIGFILSLVNSTKGTVQGFAEGTPYVTGSDGVDKVPAMLSKGERVVTVKDNQRYSPIYDYLNTHQPDPKRIMAAIASPYPNYGGLQRAYEANRQFEKEQLLSKALLEKMTFVNGNLEILVTETVKNRSNGKVKITNVNDIAKAVNNDNLRWKI